jgi:hypothetical protein
LTSSARCSTRRIARSQTSPRPWSTTSFIEPWNACADGSWPHLTSGNRPVQAHAGRNSAACSAFQEPEQPRRPLNSRIPVRFTAATVESPSATAAARGRPWTHGPDRNRLVEEQAVRSSESVGLRLSAASCKTTNARRLTEMARSLHRGRWCRPLVGAGVCAMSPRRTGARSPMAPGRYRCTRGCGAAGALI